MASPHGAAVRLITPAQDSAMEEAANAVRAHLVDASGSTITSIGGGTEYTEGDVDTTITGTAALGEKPSNTLGPLQLDSSGNLNVNVASGSLSGTEYTEDAAAPANPTGGTVVVRRTDSPNGTTVSTDGDWMALQGNSSGCLYVAFNPSDTPAVGVTGTVTVNEGSVVTEDQVSDADPTGPVSLARRRDSLAAETDANGDYIALNATNKGELYVKHIDSIPVTDNGSTLSIDDGAGSITVDGTVTANLAAGTNNIGDVDVLTVPAPLSTTGGGTEATALRVTVATDSTGVLSVDDNGGSLTVDGTVAATQSGTWTVQPGNTANTTAWKVDASSVAVPVTDNSGSLTVDNAGTFAVQDSQVLADNAGFTDGTSKVFAAGYIYDEVAGTALTENDVAAARINANRALVGTIEDGATRGRYATVSAANALKVDGSAVTQPVSGTVTANLAAGTNNIGDVDVLTVPAPLSTTGGGTEATALRVTVASDSTGVLSVDDNGSTLSIDDGAGSITVDNGGTFAVQDSQVIADNAGFTDGTSKVFMGGFIYDEVAGTALTENDAAAARINVNRAQVGIVEDGATRGRYATVTASNALKVDGSAVTQPVSGTVTANLAAGTNNIGDVDVLTVPAPLSTTGSGTEATALRVTVATDSTGVLSVDDNAGSLTVDQAYLEVSGSGSAGNATPIAATDVGAYSYVSVEVYGTFTAGMVFEASADNSTWYAQYLERTDYPGIFTNSWGASGYLLVGVPAARYFRVRVSSYTSGTVSCRAIFRMVPPMPKGFRADGTVNHDGADTGNPIKIGSRAITSSPTAVAAADRADVVSDVYGRPFVRAGHQWVAGSIWTQVHVPAANTQATKSQAAAGAGVRNVCTALTVSLVATASAPTAVQLSVALIDGASGGGTYLWRSVISLPAVAGETKTISLTDLWLPGTANTAMTLEFSAAGGANTVQSVWMSGTTVAE